MGGLGSGHDDTKSTKAYEEAFLRRNLAIAEQVDEIVDREALAFLQAQGGEAVTVRVGVPEPLDARAAIRAANDQGVGARLFPAPCGTTRENDRGGHRPVLSVPTAFAFVCPAAR
jgi:hypothetical protein